MIAVSYTRACFSSFAVVLVLSGCAPRPVPRVPSQSDDTSTPGPKSSGAVVMPTQTAAPATAPAAGSVPRNPLADYAAARDALPERGEAPQPGIALSSIPAELEGCSAEEIVGALGESSNASARLLAAKHPDDAERILLLRYIQPYGANDVAVTTPHVYLVRKAAPCLVVVSRGRVDLPSGSCVDHDVPSEGSAWEFSFDERLYGVGPGKRAFAVKLTCSISEPASGGEESHVFLFEQRDGHLVQLLAFQAEAGSLDRVSRVETLERTELGHGASQHGGYFDIVLTTHVERQTAPLDDAPPRVLAREEAVRTLRWAGTGYREGSE